ncbi:Uncharacterized protein conserved in bacteria [Actinobacillus pleuropneumoniae]|nr:Uncharacterized protein conserved in bacteria [Actinobacillus pleuropneumoniae]
MDNALLSLTHEQQQAAVEQIQELMAQGVSSGEAIQIICQSPKRSTSKQYIGEQFMKKLFAIAMLSCASISGYAETPAANMQPMLKVQVLDMSNKVGRAVENNRLSLSKTHQLCWVVFNMPFKAITK